MFQSAASRGRSGGRPAVDRKRRLFAFMAVSCQDRVGLQAETTRLLATLGADLREADMKVVRQTALGSFNLGISQAGLNLLRECLPPFTIRTGVKVRMLDVSDVDADLDSTATAQYLEFVVASDAHPQVVAEVTELAARHRLNIRVTRAERYLFPHSKTPQMRQRYIVESPDGFDRIAFIQELEALIGRPPFHGVILLPPKLTASKIW